jgi:D-beta-D-heptose 7-phosphate kinase/D-beta-D-heptose 1-phosphate adenosyltransferase
MNEVIKNIRAISKDKHLLVIGDLILDEYVFGQTERISREAPIPVFKEERFEWVCGGAANVVMNIQKSGFPVSVIGIIGACDAEGKKLLSILEQVGVKTVGIIKSNYRKTTRKQRVIVQGQQVFRIDAEEQSPLFEEERNALLAQISFALTPETTVLISDYGQGMIDHKLVAQIVQLAARVNAHVLVDPRGPLFDKYHGVDYIKPNAKEFEAMVEFFGLSKSFPLESNAIKICSMLNISGMIITLGEKGMLFVSSTESFLKEATPREVFDVTGAGDTAFAYLGIGCAVNLPMQQILELANVASGIAVSHLKNYIVSLDEIDAYFKGAIFSPYSSSHKIVFDWNLLQAMVKNAQRAGKKVVFTNGAFDLLHSGHISVIEEAKSLGDILIVALNTDASIKRYKSVNRPINSLHERALIMAALGAVDFVVSFDQNSANEILDVLRPDIMVKGGDYQPALLPEYQTIQNYGGQIHIVTFKQGYSSSNIIAKMEANAASL